MPGLVLAPETVIRRGAVWTMAVNRNQDLLGTTMIVLERPCSAVADLQPSEWADLHAEQGQLVMAAPITRSERLGRRSFKSCQQHPRGGYRTGEGRGSAVLSGWR